MIYCSYEIRAGNKHTPYGERYMKKKKKSKIVTNKKIRQSKNPNQGNCA